MEGSNATVIVVDVVHIHGKALDCQSDTLIEGRVVDGRSNQTLVRVCGQCVGLTRDRPFSEGMVRSSIGSETLEHPVGHK